MLAVVHERLEDDLLGELRSKAKAQYALSTDNRESVTEELGVILLEATGGSKAG